MDTTGRTVLDKKGSTNNTPFNKEDLTAVLKFGDVELFKDEEDENDDPVCDIDEILRMAETRDEGPAMAGDELLSAFKVAKIKAFDEDSEQSPITEDAGQDEDGESKDWDDIIPERLRKKVEEEKSREMEDLYLPPRSRKTLQQIKEGRGNKRKQNYVTGSSAEGEETDDERPRKRGRPPLTSRERIKNFTDAEIRRFVKSFKKFCVPLKRLEAVACDAELQEKPLPELKRLGELLRERCRSYMGEHTKENIDNGAPEGKKRNRGPSFKLGGVLVNAKTMMQCEEELQPLDDILPSLPEERRKWKLEARTKPAHFDVDWGAYEDSKLLQGIYQYGMGSWEQIKMDPSLGIGDKILSNEDKKPQAKHLQSRSDYLLKVLKQQLDQKKGPPVKPKRQRKSKALTKEIIEEDGSSNKETTNVADTITKKIKKKEDDSQESSEVSKDKKEKEITVKDKEQDKKREKDKKKSKKEKEKKTAGPMHFTANNEPRALDVLGGLDPSIFNKCKEKMRPVKKALKALDNPDESLSQTEQVNHTRLCLLQIGEQIEQCLKDYTDPEKIKEWRSNLWYFASKFTEFDSKKLYKLYKKACKKSSHKKNENEKPGCSSKDKGEKDHSSKRRHEDSVKKRKDKGLKKPKEEEKDDGRAQSRWRDSKPAKPNYPGPERSHDHERWSGQRERFSSDHRKERFEYGRPAYGRERDQPCSTEKRPPSTKDDWRFQRGRESVAPLNPRPMYNPHYASGYGGGAAYIPGDQPQFPRDWRPTERDYRRDYERRQQ